MRLIRLTLISVLVMCSTALAQSGQPIVTDSRIKTFVYNENDVFNILTHYNYQSNIEFGKNEEIQTVSVGDRVGWQIIPSGRRLFIRPMEERVHTNMTVVTNKRTYQFDLLSSGEQPLHPSEELVYVIRFFYPDEQPVPPTPPIYSDASNAGMMGQPQLGPYGLSPNMAMGMAPQYPQQQGMYPMQPQANYAMPMQQQSSIEQSPLAAFAQPPASVNYNYTFSGPPASAPVKIFDDGRNTYFKFKDGAAKSPVFYSIGSNGREQKVSSSVGSDGSYVVSVLAPRFVIRNGGSTITVFNESDASQAQSM